MKTVSPHFRLKTCVLLLGLMCSVPTDAQERLLKECPNSPNCVSTMEARKRKHMDPLPFTGKAETAVNRLKEQVASYKGTVLVQEDEFFLHYEFTTNIGNFIDDVQFLVDEENKVIHFRSASREGYGDLGANKRRMRKIRRDWSSNSAE